MPNKNNREPTPAQVERYLMEHPDFFVGREALLTALQLPQPGGKVVSLAERQLSALRERNDALAAQLQDLVACAKQNDQLFDRTQKMTREICAAACLEDLVERVNRLLREDFAVDVSSLTLFVDDHCTPPGIEARTVSLPDARRAISGILNSTGAVCGSLRPTELSFLFEERAQRVGSAAVAPLVNGEIVGVLALGSYDPDHYRTGMGTLFLTHVGGILGAVLPRHLSR